LKFYRQLRCGYLINPGRATPCPPDCLAAARGLPGGARKASAAFLRGARVGWRMTSVPP